MVNNISKPLYVKLYEIILKDIKEKKYSYSDKLPSENSLANFYKVNRHTIRQALQLLRENGLIYTKKGKGTFVSSINIPYCIGAQSSFTSKILDLGYEPKTKLLSAKIIYPNEEVQKALELNEKLKVIELKLLRYANDLPISVSYSYFDAFLYSKLMDNLDMKPFSIYKILEKSYPNLQVIKENTLFEASNSNKELSQLLATSLNSPILSASTISKDQNGNFVEFGTSYFRGDSCKIKVELV